MFIATLKGYNNAQCVFRIERIDNAYVNGAGSEIHCNPPHGELT